MPYVSIDRHRRRGRLEFLSVMGVYNDDATAATDLAGQRVQERFSAPRIYRRMMVDEDFLPEHQSSHRCSAAYAITRMQCGRPGVFDISETGQFKDFHGGPGLPDASMRTWFTPEAFTRGIGWTFIQRYFLGSQHLGSYWVTRIVSGTPTNYSLEVLKRRV